MGTSGAYGGSERQAWRRARARFDDVLADDTDRSIPALAQAVADALADEDPAALGPPEDEFRPEEEQPLAPLPDAAAAVQGFPAARRPRRGRQQAQDAGGVRHAATTPGVGRFGSGSRRSLARAAHRGGLAIGAAYALRRGDSEALAEVGLNLDELEAMSPTGQRLALLNATLGDATHPDDVAIRQAANEFLKQILADPPPTPLHAIRDFVATLVFRLGMVELKRQLSERQISSGEAFQKEQRLADWIRARLRRERFRVRGALVALADFRRVAARLTATALAILRAG